MPHRERVKPGDAFVRIGHKSFPDSVWVVTDPCTARELVGKHVDDGDVELDWGGGTDWKHVSVWVEYGFEPVLVD